MPYELPSKTPTPECQPATPSLEPAALLQTLLDHSPDLIYFLDRQGRLLRCSNAVAKFVGVSTREEVLGHTVAGFFSPEATAEIVRSVQQVIETGIPITQQRGSQVHPDGHVTWTLTTMAPWRDAAGNIVGVFGSAQDVTALKEAEDRLDRLNAQLRESSRQAGMAEVATSVLHNVGNVLNSVNVSATLVAEHLRQSKTDNLLKLSAMLEQHRADLAQYLSTDPRGQRIPRYLGTLAQQLDGARVTMLQEIEHLRKNLEHIHNIIAMQQAYARTPEFAEPVPVVQLIEDALQMCATSLGRHGSVVVREFQVSAELITDKHKVLQILINLLRNAAQSCGTSGRSDKQVIVRITAAHDSVSIAIIDNGVGIPTQNLTRIFNHGFTTRTDGHGFGLHSSALAAKELGGTLTAHSQGPGLGATFTLELPMNAISPTGSDT